MSAHQQQQQAAAAATPGANSGKDSAGAHHHQQQQQQQTHTPMSMAMAPLHIGLIEGLTEQQTAEMVELLTPLLSPASTPALGASSSAGAHALLRRADDARAYSPLTSPAFSGSGGADHLRLQQHASAAAGFAAMPPPSPSITAEHVMRRQQQQQQQQQMLMHHHSPSFPSAATAAALSPYLGGCRSARRRGSVSAAGSGGGSYAVGSPQYHPYRGPPQPQQLQQQRQLNQNQLNQNQLNQNQMNQNQMNQNQMNQNQLNQNQLVYTPSLLSRTATTIDTDNFFLDQLPTSAMSPQFAGSSFSASQQPRNRTLHQLNASPHIGGGGGASLLFDDSASILQQPPPPPQRSVSLNSAALAMLSSNSHYGSFIESAQHLGDSMSIAEQFSSQALLPPPASAAVAVSALSADQLMMQSACASATPASLMNLPLSAHHLPHSANGEIVSSEGSSGQSPGGTASAIVSAFGRQHITGGEPSSSSGDLLQFVTQSAPMTKFVHPPQPPPLHIGPSSSSSSHSPLVVLGGRRSPAGEHNDYQQQQLPGGSGKRTRRKSVANAAKPATAANTAVGGGGGNPRTKRSSGASSTLSSAAGRRRSRTSLLMSPHQTPLVPSTLKNVSSPGFSPYSTSIAASPGFAPLTPATLAPRRIASSQMTTPTIGPMQGSSASVTPQMRPRGSVIAATSTTNIVGLEADVVTRLATKSNYQNIMEGNSEFLGLKYKTEFKSGLERRRTNHKQAEQKRRDSLKTCFQGLEKRLPGLDPKLVSKIYLLNRANSFIDSLTRMNELLVAAAEEQGIDVAAIAAQAQAADPNACYGEEEEEEEEEDDDDDNGANSNEDMEVDKKQ